MLLLRLNQTFKILKCLWKMVDLNTIYLYSRYSPHSIKNALNIKKEQETQEWVDSGRGGIFRTEI